VVDELMPMKQRKWLYIALIFLTLVNIGVFIIVWQSGNSRGGGGFSSTQSMPRLKQSAAEAAKVLQTWLTENGPADGTVVACTLTLEHGVTESNWTFQVYSAKENRLLVTIVQEQDVRILRDIAALYRPTLLPTTAWERDINAVMKTWWREGGSTAWNTTSASTLTVHLGMREDGIPSWQLTLVKDKENVLEYWEICADTGVLLEHSSTGGL
jgi:hypothetical protein